ITELKIFGDYFSLRDTRELEQMLIGLEYSRSAVSELLNTVNVSGYFKGIFPEQVGALIVLDFLI
ncbi:hypothetical protein LI291_16245, partial [Intestinibacillus massiliensis]|nr:hypothetical protein [Intestinibacillus massiliensis]